MRQIYINHVTRIEATTPTLYTYDDRVAPGKVLILRNLCCTFTAMKTSESAQFFVDDGGQKPFLGDDVPARQGGHAYWTGCVPIGEGDRVGAYTPDSAAADLIQFSIFGELWDAKAWRDQALPR